MSTGQPDLTAPIGVSGLLARLPPANRDRLIGDVFLLSIASPMHRGMFVGELFDSLLPPLALDQFRIYRRGDRCEGFVSWARLTPDVEARAATGAYALQPADWNGGDRLWIVDFIAPHGHAAAIARDLRNNFFAGRRGFAYRVSADGRRGGIRILRGRGAQFGS